MIASRPAPLALTASQLRLEQRTFWRNRQSAAFSFGMPIMIVLFLGGLFRDSSQVGVGGTPYKSYFVAGMVGVAIMSATFVNLAINLAFQRDLLVLKRFRGTPLGPMPLFAAKVLSGVIVGLISVVLILAIGRAAYQTPLPKNPMAFLLAVLLGSAVCSMGGVAMTAVISNADAAPAVVNLPFLASQFVSGVFFPFQDMPAVLRYVGDALPLRWLVESVRAGYLGFDYVHTRLSRELRVFSSNGLQFHRVVVLRPGPVAVHGLRAITSMWPAYVAMFGWFLLFSIVAVRRFRWEPRTE